MGLDPRRLEKPLRKVRKLLKKMPAKPNPEEVHDLRTNSRRIEASFQALSLDSRRSGKRIVKQVSKLRKRAGKVRDMDVLTEYVSGMQQPEGERECLVELLEYLGAERQKSAKELSAVRDQYASSLRKRLKESVIEIEKTFPPKGAGNSSARIASADAAASALELLAELREPAHLNKTNLHPYRLKVKELHYILRMADHSDQQEFVSTLGDVKDAIGEWHDWEELTAIAKQVLNHRRDCRLLEGVRKVGNSKYEHALSLTESMRKKFLGVRADGRKPASNSTGGPTQPVWEATAALAA